MHGQGRKLVVEGSFCVFDVSSLINFDLSSYLTFDKKLDRCLQTVYK